MKISGKFLGHTKGNSDLPCNRSTGGTESPSASTAAIGGKFLGGSKGNRDLPINRTSGGGKGGK